MAGGDDPFAGERVGAAVYQRRVHHGKVVAGHEHGALTEVDRELLLHVAGERSRVVHEIGEGAVAVAGGALGGEHRVVDGQVPAREGAQAYQDAGETLVGVRSGHQ